MATNCWAIAATLRDAVGGVVLERAADRGDRAEAARGQEPPDLEIRVDAVLECAVELEDDPVAERDGAVALLRSDRDGRERAVPAAGGLERPVRGAAQLAPAALVAPPLADRVEQDRHEVRVERGIDEHAAVAAVASAQERQHVTG